MSTHPLSRLSDQDLLRDLDALIVEQRANAPELDAHIAEVEARGLCEPDEPHSKMTPIGDGKHRLKLTFRQSVMVRRIQALLDEPLSPGDVVHFALDTFVAELKKRRVARTAPIGVACAGRRAQRRSGSARLRRR